jgi:hypothetical protein
MLDRVSGSFRGLRRIVCISSKGGAKLPLSFPPPFTLFHLQQDSKTVAGHYYPSNRWLIIGLQTSSHSPRPAPCHYTLQQCVSQHPTWIQCTWYIGDLPWYLSILLTSTFHCESLKLPVHYLARFAFNSKVLSKNGWSGTKDDISDT